MKVNFKYKSLFATVTAIVAWIGIIFFYSNYSISFIAIKVVFPIAFLLLMVILNLIEGRSMEREKQLYEEENTFFEEEKEDQEESFQGENQEESNSIIKSSVLFKEDEEEWDDYEIDDMINVPVGSIMGMGVTAVILLLVCFSLFIPEFSIISKEIQIGRFFIPKNDIVYLLLIIGGVPIINQIVCEMSKLDGDGVYISIIQLLLLAITNLFFTMNCESEVIITSTLIQLCAYVFSVREHLGTKNKKVSNIFSIIGIVAYSEFIYLNQLPYGSFQNFLTAEEERFGLATQIIFQQHSYTIIYIAMVVIFYLATLVVVKKTHGKEGNLSSITCYAVLLLKILGLFSIFKGANLTIRVPFGDAVTDSILFMIILYNRFAKEYNE